MCGAWCSREPSHVLAYADRGDAGTQTTQSTVIHSPGAFEKQMRPKPNRTAGISIKTRTRPQEWPFLLLLRLAVTQEQHGHDEGLFKKALGINTLRTEKMRDEETNQFPSKSPTSWPKAVPSLLETDIDSEEQGLSTKPKWNHPVARNTSEMFLLSCPFHFSQCLPCLFRTSELHRMSCHRVA